MEPVPVLSALRRHKTVATLIVLEIALCCAIVCNIVFLVTERLERVVRDSGLAEDGILRIQVTDRTGAQHTAPRALAELSTLRATPGVAAASSVNQIPYDGNFWSTMIRIGTEPESAPVKVWNFFGDEQMIEAFGLRIVEGRDFGPEEYVDYPAMTREQDSAFIRSALVTRALADRLYPGQSPLGRTFHLPENRKTPVRIVGVVDRILSVNRMGTDDENPHAVFLPIVATQGIYALRVDPADRAAVLASATEALYRLDRNLMVASFDTLTDMRRDYYADDRAVAWLLSIVCGMLLAITTLGIGGMANFWVQQRTKQIGVRRALGASRRQILRHFQLENFILASVGIAIGMLGAYAINQWLIAHYQLSRLPALYLPAGAILLWLVGQIAVLGPARRASEVPPAVATRSL